MNWNAILDLLVQLLAAELPDLIKAIFAWIKKKFEGEELPAIHTESIATGTLEEFKQAVRNKLANLAAGSRGLRRVFYTFIARRVSDVILDKLYQLVVSGSSALTFSMMSVEEASQFDEIDLCC